MKKMLTAAAVERIKAPARGQVEYFDKGFPGLALRVSYGGGKSWVYFYRLHGRLRRLTLGTFPALELAQAREAWREARVAVAKGRDPAEERKRQKPALDFESVSAEWLKRDQDKNRTAAEAKRIIDKYVAPLWGTHPISEIGRREILDLIDGIVDRGKVVMARRVHSRLHRFFRWCEARGIIASNPMTNLPKPGAETKRDRVLTNVELVAVWNATETLGWPFGEAIRLLLLTGARREEIGALRWAEVDIAAAMIKLEGARTKNGEPHEIPLSAPALEILREAPRIDRCPFVFSTTGKTPVSGWSRAKNALDEKINANAESGIAAWRLHDLRRTIATGLQKLGVTLQVIEAVLGHVSGSRAGVVGIYQRHSFDAEKRHALDGWARFVTSLVQEQPANVVEMRGRP